MGRVFILVALLACVGTGCATPRAPAGLAMPAQDEAGAAGLLAGYLLARGWTVRLADAVTVEASRGDELLRLEPQLDPVALDRIVVARTWPRDPRADDAALRAFALELNEALNVGQFRAAAAGLVFQSSLPFFDELESRLLEVFLAWTAEVRLAVLQVQGDRQLLAPVEAGVASR
jgi:hypothetical protein